MLALALHGHAPVVADRGGHGGVFVVVGAGFEEEDVEGGVGGDAVREHAAGGAGADYDVGVGWHWGC